MMICFLLFKILVHQEYNLEVLTNGIYFVLLYGLPFILTGAIAAHFIVKKAGKHGLQINVVLGAVLSCAVVLLFHLYERIDLASFIIFTCVIGAIANYLGWKATNEKVAYALSAVIPLVLLILVV